MEKKVPFLRNINIYQGLSDEEIMCVAKHSIDKEFPKNTQIYSPFEEAPYIYVIKKGEVQLYHHVGDKKSVFNILTPGTVFGCFNTQTNTPNHFAECTQNCYVCVTPVKEFLQLVTVYPEMMLRLMQNMAQRLDEYEQKIESSL